MNARQKCKQLKKQLEALYQDYVTSAMMTQAIFDEVGAKIDRMREQQVICGSIKYFDASQEVDDDLAIEMFEQLTYDPNFRQAVVFEGHTDPDTGKYILEATLTVVMPELGEDEEEK